MKKVWAAIMLSSFAVVSVNADDLGKHKKHEEKAQAASQPSAPAPKPGGGGYGAHRTALSQPVLPHPRTPLNDVNRQAFQQQKWLDRADLDRGNARVRNHINAGNPDADSRAGNFSHERDGLVGNHHNDLAALRNWHGNPGTYADACRRYRREHHNRDWWCHNYRTIILIGGGYYYWDTGWWYPAWGYDSYYSSYSFDGPIFGYDGLPPDEVIARVQTELQREGYFEEAVDGVLGSSTRAAIANFQRDHGLYVTASIDAPTMRQLGFLV